MIFRQSLHWKVKCFDLDGYRAKKDQNDKKMIKPWTGQTTASKWAPIRYISSHVSLNREGQMISQPFFSHFSLFSTALCDLTNSRPVHSLMLSSHLFLCLPCLLTPFIVPCKMVLARPDERETSPYHCSLRLFIMVRKSSCGPIACWILAWTSSLVTWSLYEMRSILQ